MNTMPNSGFPRCPDGDVYIVVSTSKSYQLHSNVLRRASSHFKLYLEQQPPAKLNAAARREGCAAWRFHLSPHPYHPDGVDLFLPVSLTDSGKVRESVYHPRRQFFGVGNEDLDNCWDWLFGCFYGIAPNFDDSTLATTVQDCLRLVDAANSIRSLEQVQEVIDLALMRQDTVLWKAVASDPIEWAQFGYRVRSPGIFKEAVIHIIGKWKMETDDAKANLPAEIHDLCERKWNELELVKRGIEIRIAGHYPSFLCRNHVDKPHRTAYSTDIYMWMALSYFRQYMAQAGNDGKTRLADDGGYDYYRKFSIGGNAYLHHEDLNSFHELFPMSLKACGIFEAHMNVLKEDVKDFVKDLMVVRTHVDPATLANEHGLAEKPWMTCAVIGKEDLPWHVSEESGLVAEENAAVDNNAWSVIEPSGRSRM